MAIVHLATEPRNAATDAVAAHAGGGSLEIRSGTMPSSADEAAAGTLLAAVVFEDPAYGSASGGSAALVDPDAVTGVAAGTATWCRIVDSEDGAVLDGDVTTTGGGGFLELATTTISVGLQVDITGGSLTMPAS